MIQAKTPAVVGIPNDITAEVVDNTGPKNARIGYKNLLTATTTSAAAKALTPNTYERYKPASGGIVKFQMGTSASINFIAFGAHNAGTHEGGISISVGYATTIGGATIPIETINFENDSAKMITFDTVSAAEVIISFLVGTGGLELGVIYAGEYMEMQRPIYGGHSPIDLSSKTEYESAISETGNFLGRTIKSQGVESKFDWQHLDPDWYRDTFQLFVESAKTTPFFIQWRPELYDVTTFGVTTSDIQPDNMGGGHRLMSVSFNIRGHVN